MMIEVKYADTAVSAVHFKAKKPNEKAKALSALAHKLGRCVYFMLKNETVFDERQFLKS